MKYIRQMNPNWKMFWSMLKISATTFGGGFVIVPLLKRKFADEEKQIEEEEMLELAVLAQSCPGPIAVNASVMVGYRIAGIRGALTALTATVIPPLGIISVLSLFYDVFKENEIIKILMAGMLCGVSAVIIDVVLQMIRKPGQKLGDFVLLGAAFIMAVFFRINVILIISGAVLIGILTKGFKRG